MCSWLTLHANSGKQKEIPRVFRRLSIYLTNEKELKMKYRKMRWWNKGMRSTSCWGSKKKKIILSTLSTVNNTMCLSSTLIHTAKAQKDGGNEKLCLVIKILWFNVSLWFWRFSLLFSFVWKWKIPLGLSMFLCLVVWREMAKNQPKSRDLKKVGNLRGINF